MKKFMKVCAIAALIMIVLGAVLGILGVSAAGGTLISQVVDQVTGGRIKVGTGEGLWGIDFGVHYDIGNSSMFSKSREILSGDVEKYCPGDGIRNLQVEVGGCSFETRTSEDGNFYLETKDVRKFQGYTEGDTLYIKAVMGSGLNWFKDSRIILYLPDDYSFEEVLMDIGAGEIECRGLKADEMILDVGAGRIFLEKVQARKMEADIGAGQIELKDMRIGELDAGVGMGEFLADGVIEGDVDVECSMGNVEIRIDARKEDFNYQLEGAMGMISLDRDSYGGLAEEKEINNGADKNMDIECSMGNITIKFTE